MLGGIKTDKKALSSEVKAKAQELGYDLCGIVRADTFHEYTAYLDERIKHFPDSRPLFEDLYEFAHPQEKLEGAKSIIVCVRRYSKYKLPAVINKYIGKLYLFERRLESSKEYSDDNKFEAFLRDIGMHTYKGGVAARWAAVKAGLGFFGNNNFLYTKFGSWVAIDTWIVDKEMEYDKPPKKTSACPPNCGKCIAACPTKALSGPHMMDMGKCVAQLSYFSTELYSTELIPEELREKMGTWLYGCDICQDVCPMNKNRWKAAESFPGLDEMDEFIKLENIVKMDEKTFLDIIQPRFWYIEKDGLWIWKCNALQAMVNSGDAKYHKYIKEACTDINENVRKMATWACKKLAL